MEKGMTEGEIVGWHHWLDGHEPAPGVGDGQADKLQSMGLQRVGHDWATRWWLYLQICYPSSVQFSLSVVPDSLRICGLEHARIPCPSPTPRACSNSCPSSWWCHPTISPSVVPFSYCLQSFPASGSFPMSQVFTSGGQSVGFSFSISPSSSVLISFRIDWFDLSVQSTHKSLLKNHNLQESFLQHSAFLFFSSHVHSRLLEKLKIWLNIWQNGCLEALQRAEKRKEAKGKGERKYIPIWMPSSNE